MADRNAPPGNMPPPLWAQYLLLATAAMLLGWLASSLLASWR